MYQYLCSSLLLLYYLAKDRGRDDFSRLVPRVFAMHKVIAVGRRGILTQGVACEKVNSFSKSGSSLALRQRSPAQIIISSRHPARLKLSRVLRHYKITMDYPKNSLFHSALKKCLSSKNETSVKFLSFSLVNF